MTLLREDRKKRFPGDDGIPIIKVLIAPNTRLQVAPKRDVTTFASYRSSVKQLLSLAFLYSSFTPFDLGVIWSSSITSSSLKFSPHHLHFPFCFLRFPSFVSVFSYWGIIWFPDVARLFFCCNQGRNGQQKFIGGWIAIRVKIFPFSVMKLSVEKVTSRSVLRLNWFS